MFNYSLFKIIGDTSVKYSLLVVGKNINLILSIIIEHNRFRIDASFLGMTINKVAKSFRL